MGYYIIVGCGRMGSGIANLLSDRGEDVIVIDLNEKSFDKLSSSFGGMTIVADGMEIDTLQDYDADKASGLILTTDNDNVNSMIAQIGKHIFNIPKVISRVYESEKETLYNDMNIETACPTTLSVNAVSHYLFEE